MPLRELAACRLGPERAACQPVVCLTLAISEAVFYRCCAIGTAAALLPGCGAAWPAHHEGTTLL